MELLLDEEDGAADHTSVVTKQESAHRCKADHRGHLACHHGVLRECTVHHHTPRHPPPSGHTPATPDTLPHPSDRATTTTTTRSDDVGARQRPVEAPAGPPPFGSRRHRATPPSGAVRTGGRVAPSPAPSGAVVPVPRRSHPPRRHRLCPCR